MTTDDRPTTNDDRVNVPSTISSNTTWTAGNIYQLTALTTVNTGVTLTVQAGAIVKFQPSSGLYVRGKLVGSGTAENPVVFTSIKHDTFGGDTNRLR